MRALIAFTAAFLLFAQTAQAEISRDEYKSAVEPICKANSQANERILKGVRQEVKANKLKKAATRFSKAQTALNKAYSQLKAVAQPEADVAKLTKWLGYVKIEADLFGTISKKLKAGQRGAAQAKVSKLTSNANLANSTVLAFGFHYCRFEPSKFT
jgi:ribosome maturation protein Sdo1